MNGLKEISTGLVAELEKYCSAGGAVIVFPAVDIDINPYSVFLNQLKAKSFKNLNSQAQPVAFINTQQAIFKDIFIGHNENMDLPTAYKYYELSGSNQPEEKILVLKNGSTLTGRYSCGQGNLFLNSVGLTKEMSDLPLKAIFVPMMVKMVFSSIKLNDLAYTMGENRAIALPELAANSESALRLKNSSQEFIPGQTNIENTLYINTGNQVKVAGIFELELPTSAEKPSLAFNYNRTESALKFYDETALKEKLQQGGIELINVNNKNMAAVAGEINEGVVLWKWCVILALLFLLVEVALLRFWKK